MVNILTKVEKLEEMIAYQDGAVVSRTLINRPTGTVTLFSFDKGEGLSEHTAPYDALVYLMDGEVKITIGKTEYNLKKGDSIIMPEDIPHALQAISKFKMLLIMIKQ
jgi:quercetin dioxygenase-like cupin family protein